MTLTDTLSLEHTINACTEPDFVLLGLWADALAEAGDEDERGVRWAIERGRWPGPQSNGEWVWYSVLETNAAVGEDLSNYWIDGGWYPTITAAFRDLASMLRKAEGDGVDVEKL